MFAGEALLTTADQATLRRSFETLPKPEKVEPLRGAVWLSDREAPKVSMDVDRGRLALADDSVARFRALTQGDVARLFGSIRVISYSFKSAK